MKVRVYEVARQLNIDKKALVSLFQSMGIDGVRNHLSEVDLDVVERVKRHLDRQKTPSVVEERIRPTVSRRPGRAADRIADAVASAAAVALGLPAGEAAPATSGARAAHQDDAAPLTAKLALIAETIRRIQRGEDCIRFVLVGRTGTGKSSTVNSLLGQEIAPVHAHRPKTIDVKEYRGERDGIPLAVIDTPGLCDDLPEAGKDQQYIDKIRRFVPRLDSMWYVAKLDDNRLASDDMRAIRMLSQAFPSAWDTAVIVLTHADKVSADFDGTVRERGALIRSEIGKYFAGANDIPVVAVSNVAGVLPNQQAWLPELFTAVATRFNTQTQLAFLLGMRRDVAPDSKSDRDAATPRIVLSAAQRSKIGDSVLKGALAGAVGGARIGLRFGPVGVAVGGVLGAALGALIKWLFR